MEASLIYISTCNERDNALSASLFDWPRYRGSCGDRWVSQQNGLNLPDFDRPSSNLDLVVYSSQVVVCSTLRTDHPIACLVESLTSGWGDIVFDRLFLSSIFVLPVARHSLRSTHPQFALFAAPCGLTGVVDDHGSESRERRSDWNHLVDACL